VGGTRSCLNEFYLPGADGIRAQSKTNKQGSEGQIEETDAQGFSTYLAEFCAKAYEKYERGDQQRSVGESRLV
jgi:hypothetical protein